ncbi:MAG TPA: pyridoxamine 5'-phosphate oxidase family protein, partial [Thermodesulfobacteriota bacterium]|nr:pyridoxamine 5'-phosphate oxidase family protein [Thermodesulfobacteriota bacterium]
MRAESLIEAEAISRKVGHVFMATADPKGVPHVAPGDNMTVGPGPAQVAIEAWFCPGTVANLDVNPSIAVIAWDAGEDQGFQVLGWAEKVEDIALLDGMA